MMHGKQSLNLRELVKKSFEAVDVTGRKLQLWIDYINVNFPNWAYSSNSSAWQSYDQAFRLYDEALTLRNQALALYYQSGNNSETMIGPI